MSARKRPAAAALATAPRKRLRGKQEAPGYNKDLPKEFLAWRAQRVYFAYKSLGGAQAMEELVGSLSLAEPNPIHYAEYMGIYTDGRLAAEGQPPIACLGLLVAEWGAELTVMEWKVQREEAAARTKPVAWKKPAGRRGKTNYCRGFDGSLCRFNAREPGQPSRGLTGAQTCLLRNKTLLQQSLASPRGRGNLTRVLKTLRANEKNPNIFEAACARLTLWLSAEEAAELRAKAAAAKRARPKQTRAAVRAERLSVARASFSPAIAKRQTSAPAPTYAAWRAYRTKAVAEQRWGKKRFYPEAARRVRAVQTEIAAGAEVDNSPDLPAASHSPESIALQKWCLRGAWGMCPNCNILQARPLTSACFEEVEHAATIQPSACKTCKRGLRKHYVPQFNDIPEPLRGLSENAEAALRLLDYDLGPESRADNGYRKHVRMIRFSWAPKTPKQKIAELPEHSERRRARGALRHLLGDDASAYSKFHADHQDFLNLRGGALEVAARRPLRFIEELGLECAVWPALYWKTSMCETHERYTDRRRLEREHDEADLEDVEGADGQRHSIKRSFRAKLLGPLLGYGSNFALLQFVYDLQLWTELGAKRNMAERHGSKMRLMMAQHPMSPLYWRAVLAGLQDLVRQIGPPQLYWTFAPWELSFPYSEFLLDELRKQLRTRYGAPAHETLHMAHCMLEAVRGFVAGGAGQDKPKWKRYLLQGHNTEGEPAGCFHFFTRLEFQDGSKKAGTQRYHGSGRPHLHVLFWLDAPECLDWEQCALAEWPSAEDSPALAAFVQGSQEDRAGESRWPICAERSHWDPATDCLQLRHSAKAAKAGLRAFFPDLMDCFRCHQDLQASDGRQLLLTYVAKYVAALWQLQTVGHGDALGRQERSRGSQAWGRAN